MSDVTNRVKDIIVEHLGAEADKVTFVVGALLVTASIQSVPFGATVVATGAPKILRGTTGLDPDPY